MNKILPFFLIVFFSCTAYSEEKIRLLEISKNLNEPWGMTFIDDNNLLLTEKTGEIIRINIETGEKFSIDHELDFFYFGQGGLLDILYKDNYVYVTYSEDRDEGKSSTSIARGLYNDEKIIFENIFRAEPPISSGYHFGSRIVIKNDHLFASIGERGGGMIAQDVTSHPGSIIRIHLDGAVPNDNPKFINRPEWLPEVYQIGIRNPQGMYLSPFNEKVYISNHGAKGGDFFGEVKFGENYGWKIIGWGGTNYIGTSIGDGSAWKPGFTKPIWTWTPSIAVCNILIYNGELYPEWKGDVLVTSLKYKTLYRLKFENNEVKSQHIIFENRIGRLRDIEVNSKGEIFLINANSNASLWKLEKF
ncbi:MAG: glucose dehydrogenase [Gammaproteobacteria bacterium TMED257]|nr:MAG: glucose dehydrogenase [Gammaproteobacteria bacterium TMED257]|tara:strand:- start:53 stop:1132 length:1080 start_codon:yes stop_codon:yes gene_type:complete